MKILLVSGSPRGERSVTFTFAKEILKGARDAGAEVETEHLSGRKVGFCHACESCHKAAMTCHIKDEAHIVILKMLNADGVVFATPNYVNQVTGQMKALFDRTSNLIHCQRLLGKYTAAAVSSGSGNNQPVADYIGSYSRLCGAQFSGSVSCGHAPSAGDLKAASALGAKLAGDIRAKTVYEEQMKEIETRRRYFAELISRRKTDWDGEYRYYTEKVWL